MTAVERAILIADLAGFTALAEAHGDHDAAEVATRFADLAHGGLRGGARVVKTMGDAVLIVAPDAAAAFDTALALAAAVEAEPAYPGVSAGLHCGTVVERHGDVYGGAVNRAARLAAHAGAGRVLVTAPFAAALPADRRERLRPAGEARFKNLPDPVELYDVDRGPAAPAEMALDPVCHMRLDPGTAAATVEWDGRAWHLCSATCAAAFRARPETYAGAPRGMSGSDDAAGDRGPEGPPSTP